MSEEIIVNKAGGKQSKIAGKMTEVPPLALIAVSNVMGNGSIKYPREANGTPNWHKINSLSNLDHGLEHAANFCNIKNIAEGGDGIIVGELLRELSHHAARAMMALEMFIIEEDVLAFIKENNL